MTGTTKLHMDGISRIKCNILFIVAGILCVPANVTAQFITISESSAMTAETPNKVAVESDAERRTYQADSSYYANRRGRWKKLLLQIQLLGLMNPTIITFCTEMTWNCVRH